MIRLTDNIWIGDSVDVYDQGLLHRSYGDHDDEVNSRVDNAEIQAVLNVAQDMNLHMVGWPDVEYMHVGLVDGPGNPRGIYIAAVLALATLLGCYERVLVCCHGGRSRSLAVVLLYLILKGGKNSDHPTFLNYWKPWRRVIQELRESTGKDLPWPNTAHTDVIEKLPLALIEGLL